MIEKKALQKMGEDQALKARAQDLFLDLFKHKYPYHFTWLGRPIIQFPQDIVAVQEIIWRVKPDLIIETGIAHGGSLILSSSMLALLDLFEGTSNKRKVVGVDVLIKENNRSEIESHPLSSMIELIVGSSVDENVTVKLNKICTSYNKIMVFLDSNHAHEHVYKELELYSKFVTKGSYLVIFDTVIDKMPDNFFKDRSWGSGNNPMTALNLFLEKNKNFEIDSHYDEKLILSVAPNGFLRKIR